MKIGDLVKLSSYGKKRGYNSLIDKQGQVGIIVSFTGATSYPYKVLWQNLLFRNPHTHSRKELKYANR